MSAKHSALSPTYTRWILEAVGRTFASEPRATCGDCAMCQPPLTSLDRSFSPSLKCCTYWPDLPNFMVGRALLAGGEGARRLRDQIDNRIGLTPFGLQSSPAYHRRYEAQPGKFGMDVDMRCPYYDDGDCTIWQNRNSICQTYFCRVEDGVPGKAIWHQLTLLLALIEEKLSVDCATRRLTHPSFYTAAFQPHGVRNRVTARNFPGWIEENGRIGDELHAQLWGDWSGREVAFFEACAADVEGLSWTEVLTRVGQEADVLARRLRSMVSLSPPSYLRPARPGLALEFDERPDGVAYTSVHGSLEVYLAPQELWNALLDFEGGPLTTEGLALPDRILPLSEVVTLWKTGLLMEGRPTSDRLIEPEDLFRVVPELPVHERILFSEAGQASVQLGFGVTQITFDEPDLLNFGRSLYTHRLGFLASEAPSWSGRSWERSVELLESLLAMGLLERM